MKTAPPCTRSSSYTRPTMTSLTDSYLWLEDVDSPASLEWVREHSREAEAKLASSPQFKALEQRLLAQLNSSERIPTAQMHGSLLYNFWQDAEHPKGVWRRTSLESYQLETPEWESVLDLDRLSALEGESWVWQGARFLQPFSGRALLVLSRGGKDANVLREFDVLERRFVVEGFNAPESKGGAAWLDPDTLLIARDFGLDSRGESTMTTSGYPRTVRHWKRGEALEDAQTMFNAELEDMGVWPFHSRTRGISYHGISRRPGFYTQKCYLWRSGELVTLELPDDAVLDFWGEYLLVSLRSEWLSHPSGSLLALPLEEFLSGARNFHRLYTPSETGALEKWVGTRNHLWLSVLENVQGRILRLTPQAGGWESQRVSLPLEGTVDLCALDADASDAYFLSATDYLTPSSLYLVDGEAQQKLKSLPHFFNSEGLKVQQFEALSQDGTRVPYSVVARADVVLDGQNPTLLYGYGGFEVSLLSDYDPRAGIGWLEGGGIYVEANIRGGGEFGPRWHQAALREHRQRAYDDFIAVAQDLVARGFTSSAKLGIWGGSNGGLLTGNMLVQRPELFGAVVCQVPLLDMWRYHKLLAGASWIAEFGDPDSPEDWAFLQNYSPYQLLEQGVKYPPVLLTTSTRDDRVHPGHARKMAARMLELGQNVLFWENTEGGHAGAADAGQRARMQALIFEFLRQTLG